MEDSLVREVEAKNFPAVKVEEGEVVVGTATTMTLNLAYRCKAILRTIARRGAKHRAAHEGGRRHTERRCLQVVEGMVALTEHHARVHERLVRAVAYDCRDAVVPKGASLEIRKGGVIVLLRRGQKVTDPAGPALQVAVLSSLARFR